MRSSDCAEPGRGHDRERVRGLARRRLQSGLRVHRALAAGRLPGAECHVRHVDELVDVAVTGDRQDVDAGTNAPR